jgi:hypothetical protein
MANTRETLIGISFRQQSALGTPVTNAAEFWRIAKTNASLASVVINTEDDAQDIGKGDEWANNVYLTSKDVNVPLEGYLTSQKLALAFAFGFGKTTKTTPAAGAYTYTCVPADPVADGSNAPLACVVEQIRPGGSSVIDRRLEDCALDSFGFRMNSGVGRQNATINMNWIGSGRETNPSAVTLPAALVEAGLNAGSFTISVNGVNYLTGNRFVDCEFNYANNINAEDSFFPGSGTDDGAQVRGRQERGDRAITFRFRARFNSGSTELATFLAQTEGTVALGWTGALITGSTFHGATITGHRTRLRSAAIEDGNGKVIVNCEVVFLKHASNGVITAAITTNADNILAVAT